MTVWIFIPVATATEHGEQRQLLGFVGDRGAVEFGLALDGHDVVVGFGRTEHVATGLGDRERVGAQARIVGQEHVRLLGADGRTASARTVRRPGGRTVRW